MKRVVDIQLLLDKTIESKTIQFMLEYIYAINIPVYVANIGEVFRQVKTTFLFMWLETKFISFEI